MLHLVDLQVPPALPPGATQTLKAQVDWLVCKETCIPESVELALTLPVAAAAGADPTWAAPIAATRRALPRPLAGWQASAEGRGASIALTLVAPDGAGDPGKLRFFPLAERQIEPSSLWAKSATRPSCSRWCLLPVSSGRCRSSPASSSRPWPTTRWPATSAT